MKKPIRSSLHDKRCSLDKKLVLNHPPKYYHVQHRIGVDMFLLGRFNKHDVTYWKVKTRRRSESPGQELFSVTGTRTDVLDKT